MQIRCSRVGRVEETKQARGLEQLLGSLDSMGQKRQFQSGPPIHPSPCLVHFLLYFLVQKKARNIRAESSRGLSRLCGESSNVLMLHMVTSGPSRGPTSSPHTEDRRSTSQGLSHTLCARTCCPVGFHPICDRERETHQR